MKKINNIFLFSILVIFCLNIQAGSWRKNKHTEQQKVELTADGPYVCYQPDGKTNIISVTTDGNIEVLQYDSLPDNYSVSVVSHDGKIQFTVPLHPIKRPAWKYEDPEKILVMSDPHANLECVISLLQANKVIDKNLNWIFKKNQLMIIGDIFDRGYDATQIFWLVYKLEAEAEKAGGKVHFLLGNHEPMELSNDLRYAKEKYKALADSLDIEFASLYSPETELGRWIGKRNTIQIIGDNLYVHAGLGKDFYDQNLNIPDVNEKMSEVLFMKSKQRKQVSPLHAFLYGNEGPIWYRGLVRTDRKYKPCTPDTLQMILQKHNVNHIIVGHTIFKDISTFYDGKVIGVNVDNKKNKKKHKGRGILIEQGEYYVVGDKGKIRKLFK